MIFSRRLLCAFCRSGSLLQREPAAEMTNDSQPQRSGRGLMALLVPSPSEFYFSPTNNRCLLCDETTTSPSSHLNSIGHETAETILEHVLQIRLRTVQSQASDVAHSLPFMSTATATQRTPASTFVPRQQNFDLLPFWWGSRLFGASQPSEPLTLLGAFHCFLRHRRAQRKESDRCNKWQLCEEFTVFMRSATILDCAMEEKFLRVRAQLCLLRDIGVLPVAFSSDRRALAMMGTSQSSSGATAVRRGIPFQRLECIGDHNWTHHINGRIRRLLPHHDHYSPDMIAKITYLRCSAEGNFNLDDVAVRLKVHKLFPGSEKLSQVNQKYRADLIECVIGELRTMLWTLESPEASNGFTVYPSNVGGRTTLEVIGMIEQTLNDLLNLVTLTLFTRYYRRIVDIVESIVATNPSCIWLQGPLPQKARILSKAKRCRSFECRRLRLHAVPVRHASETQQQLRAKLRIIPPETVSMHVKQLTFPGMNAYLQDLNIDVIPGVSDTLTVKEMPMDVNGVKFACALRHSRDELHFHI